MFKKNVSSLLLPAALMVMMIVSVCFAQESTFDITKINAIVWKYIKPTIKVCCFLWFVYMVVKNVISRKNEEFNIIGTLLPIGIIISLSLLDQTFIPVYNFVKQNTFYSLKIIFSLLSILGSLITIIVLAKLIYGFCKGKNS